jgi:hypothetical protein
MGIVIGTVVASIWSLIRPLAFTWYWAPASIITATGFTVIAKAFGYVAIPITVLGAKPRAGVCPGPCAGGRDGGGGIDGGRRCIAVGVTKRFLD